MTLQNISFNFEIRDKNFECFEFSDRIIVEIPSGSEINDWKRQLTATNAGISIFFVSSLCHRKEILKSFEKDSAMAQAQSRNEHPVLS